MGSQSKEPKVNVCQLKANASSVHDSAGVSNEWASYQKLA